MAKTTYRQADPADALSLLRLLTLMHKEGAPCSLNQVKMADTIEDVLRRGFVIVAEAKGDIVGSAAVQKKTYWYSDDVFYSDVWTFVHPAYRKSRIQIKMINTLKQCAEEDNLPLTVEVFGLNDTSRKNKLVGKLMQPAGEIFVWGF